MKNTLKIMTGAAFIFALSISTVNAANVRSTNANTNGQANATQKLTEAKLRVCQNKESGIQKRNIQLNKMAENMMTKFDAITTRVKTYYTEKALPNGVTVSNYDALVSEIATKKAAVQTSLTKANTDSTAFSCTSDGPKGQLTQYRVDMQAVKQSLKDYRTSIKNLIVAIHTASETSNSNLNINSNANRNANSNINTNTNQ